MRKHGADMLWKVYRYAWRNWRRKKRRMKRRRHRKKNWDKHFCIQACWYIQTCLTHNCDFAHILFTEPTLLHTIVFTQKKLLHTNTFRLGTYAFTQTLLHRDSFAHKHFYTQTRLHTNPFTHKLFTHKHFYTQPFYTETLSYTDAFTHRPFRTQTLLHTNTFTHRRFYTERLLHRDANNWVTDVLYAKEKKMLQMISRKKIEMICEDSKLKPAEVHRKSFICKYF